MTHEQYDELENVAAFSCLVHTMRYQTGCVCVHVYLNNDDETTFAVCVYENNHVDVYACPLFSSHDDPVRFFLIDDPATYIDVNIPMP